MRSGLPRLQRAHAAEVVEHALLRLLAHRARVEEDDVGVLGAVGEREAVGGGEHVGHLVRVVLVHLAAERADVELRRHGRRPGAGGYPVGARVDERARIIAKRGRPRALAATGRPRLQSSHAGVRRESLAAGETGTRCRADSAAPIRSCPRNGKPVRAAHDATVRASADGKAGGQDWRARRPACDRVARAHRRRRATGDARACRRRRRRTGSVATAARGCAALAEIAMRDRFASRRRRSARRRAAVASSLAVGAGAQRPSDAPTTFDPVVVTAARGPQPIADVLADVTVIGARRDRARRRAEPDRTPAAPARRRDLAERRPGLAVGAIFLRGANRGQTLVLIDGMRIASSSAGRDVARGDPARPDRPHRDPARTGVEPLRRRCDRRRRSRCSRGAATARPRQRERGLRHLRHLGRRRRASAAARAPLRYAVQGAAPGSARLQRDRESGRLSRTTPTATATNRSDASANLVVSLQRASRKSPAQYFHSRLDNQFDGGPGFDDRTITDGRDVAALASRNRAGVVLGRRA